MEREKFIKSLSVDLEQKKIIRKIYFLFPLLFFIPLSIEFGILNYQNSFTQVSTILLIGILSFLLTLYIKLTVPGRSIIIATILSAVTLVLYLFSNLMNLDFIELQDDNFWSLTHFFCPIHILFYSIPILLVLYFFGKNHFTTSPIQTLFIAGTISALFAEFILSFFCISGSNSHILVWHLLFWTLPILIGIIGLKEYLTW